MSSGMSVEPLEAQSLIPGQPSRSMLTTFLLAGQRDISGDESPIPRVGTSHTDVACRAKDPEAPPRVGLYLQANVTPGGRATLC